MATAMDEQLLEERSWALQLKRGEEITLIPWDDQPFLVTDVFLVDPESIAGQGVVAACVEMGTRNIMLAQLSSEMTDVELELETSVVLHEKFRFYVMRQGGDSDADTDTGEDAVVVQFEGLVLPLPSSDDDEDSEEEEDGDEEDSSSEDDDDETDEECEEEDKESNGEVN